MSTKNLVRTIVAAGLIAWPSVEIYRLQAAKKDLAARLQVESKVNVRLAMARQKNQLAQAAQKKF